MLDNQHIQHRDIPSSSRSSVFDMELRNIRIESPGSVEIEMNEAYDEFTPVMGKFGAPKCRCTSSLISLIAMMIGLILITVGLCMLLFFTQEALLIPPGITFSVIGFLLLLIGCSFWTSEFLCNDCLGDCFVKMQEAPMKNAIKRREERLKSAASSRMGSRLSVNSRTSLASRQTVSTNTRY